MSNVDILKINDAIELKIFKGGYERPIELTSENEFVTTRLIFNRQDTLKIVAVLTEYLEKNNG